MTTALDAVRAITGLTLEQIRAEAPPEPQPGQDEEVPDTAELRRILSLPRRFLEDLDSGLVAALSAALERTGEQHLRPIQALALHDIHQTGGLFGPIRVGGGKTLITYLAPVMLDAKRPLLLVPAKLREKTRREFARLAQHWHGPAFIRIESYELLGRPQAAKMLEDYRPDLVMLDEAHKVKNPRAAVTRRVKRFLESSTTTRVVAMSGTITKRSLKDYSHVARWCLPAGSPVPITHRDLDAWADALDEKTSSWKRVRPGALITLCNAEEARQADYGGEEGLAAVRTAFRRRMVETPGVVATQEGPMDMSLSIAPLDPDGQDPDVDDAFRILKDTWERPDGCPISDPITMWRHSRELGLGFYYRWTETPPEAWLDARKAWASWCRDVLRYNRRGMDSESQVAMAVDRGQYDDGGLLARWREVKPSFEPETEAVWVSTEALEAAERWIDDRKRGGIVWVEHVEFGKELARRTGLPYYGRGGEDPSGRRIEDHPPGEVMIASVASNAEGRNLQAWSENLIVCAPPNGAIWEQLLGRTHRDGQTADEVSFWLYCGCFAHVAGFWQAVKDSKYTQDTTGQAQKLLYADSTIPDLDEVRFRKGARWAK